MPGTETADIQPEAALEIDALTQLLREEIAAIDRGDLDKVTELYPRKAALLEALEAAAPALRESSDTETGMREKLQQLQELVRKDAALLARMTEATSDLVSEISRIRDRHGLKGLYGVKGEVRDTTVTVSQRIDQQV
jgi:hypothetical protein